MDWQQCIHEREISILGKPKIKWHPAPAQLGACCHPVGEGLVQGRAGVKAGREEVTSKRDEHVVALQVLLWLWRGV